MPHKNTKNANYRPKHNHRQQRELRTTSMGHFEEKLMKKSLILGTLVAFTLSAPAFATCTGTGAFQSCFDSNGNSYTVQRFGNSTHMQGYNAQTGSNWSQNSQTFGNTTIHNGYAADGGSWNMTQQQLGGGFQTFSGTDSNGNFFNRICDAYGNCN